MTTPIQGRPRVHDREAIAAAMIEWAKKDDSLNLCAFCCSREPPLPPQKLTLWASEDEGFREAYSAVKSFIGARREQKLAEGCLHVKAYDLNAHVYDYFLKAESREELRFKSELEKEVAASIPRDVVDGQKTLMTTLKGIQDAVKPSKQ